MPRRVPDIISSWNWLCGKMMYSSIWGDCSLMLDVDCLKGKESV